MSWVQKKSFPLGSLTERKVRSSKWLADCTVQYVVYRERQAEMSEAKHVMKSVLHSILYVRCAMTAERKLNTMDLQKMEIRFPGFYSGSCSNDSHLDECRLVLLQHFFKMYCLHAQGDNWVQIDASANYLNQIQCNTPENRDRQDMYLMSREQVCQFFRKSLHCKWHIGW